MHSKNFYYHSIQQEGVQLAVDSSGVLVRAKRHISYSHFHITYTIQYHDQRHVLDKHDRGTKTRS